jgi:activator of 2-hydroxyglutaryl-CoA dehydratase
VKITTTCTVFAESEVLSWLGKGKKIEDILLGVHKSIAARSAGLLRRVGVEEQVTFTGGVARRTPPWSKRWRSGWASRLNVSEESHYMGALGAALFALDHVLERAQPRRAARRWSHEVHGGDRRGLHLHEGVVLDADHGPARAMRPTGFRLADVARGVLDAALEEAGLRRADVAYVVTTGFGRHQTEWRMHVGDRPHGRRPGGQALFPGTRPSWTWGGRP